MTRKTGAFALILLLLGGLIAAPANAGVPRTLLAEDYTADW